MAWAKAHIEIKPATVGTGVKCMLRQTKRAAASITISMNAMVAAAAGIKDGDGIEVMIGEAEHHGLIRIRKNNSAASTKALGRETGKGAFFLIKLGHQPAFVDRSEPSAWCQWEKVEDGWVEIVLPKWADETAPHKARQQITTATQVLSPVRKPASVTAQLMGDPEPGRREAVEKLGRKEALATVGNMKV